MSHCAWLPDRSVIEVAGDDRTGFLQGLVSNDVEQVAPGRAVWAALLTPQGKYLADFFMLDGGDRLLLDCAAPQAAMLVSRLNRFRLRARVAVRDLSPAWRVFAAWGGVPDLPDSAIGAPDPRLPDAGWRILSAGVIGCAQDAGAWDAHRLALGLPDGARDLEVEKTVLLEAGFDELHGVSWTKGCYMGQELTARTKYRGLIKRRLLPVRCLGALPEPGTPIVTADGRDAGTVRSGRGQRALATVRLDLLDQPLTCLGLAVDVRRPDWVRLPGQD